MLVKRKNKWLNCLPLCKVSAFSPVYLWYLAQKISKQVLPCLWNKPSCLPTMSTPGTRIWPFPRVLARLDPRLALHSKDFLTDCNFNTPPERLIPCFNTLWGGFPCQHSISLFSIIDYVIFHVILKLVSKQLHGALGDKVFMQLYE